MQETFFAALPFSSILCTNSVTYSLSLIIQKTNAGYDHDLDLSLSIIVLANKVLNIETLPTWQIVDKLIGYNDVSREYLSVWVKSHGYS